MMKRETFDKELIAGLDVTHITNKTIVLPFDEDMYDERISLEVLVFSRRYLILGAFQELTIKLDFAYMSTISRFNFSKNQHF